MASGNNYIGKTIGNYCVISQLATGSSAGVYLAQHIILSERTVAIKLMHEMHLGTEQESTQFLQEAQFLEKLKHPYILPILDVGIYDNFPYIVTDYATSGSLRNRIKSHPSHLLSIDDILIVFSQIGNALHYAHLQNIIHRDLKPEK